MTRLARLLLASLLCVTVTSIAAAQPPKGSQMPADEVSCFMCHSEEGLWEGEKKRLYISKESLSEDVHFKNGVNCHDCHGGDPTSFDVPEAHSTVVAEGQSKVLPFRSPLAQVWDACGNCHNKELIELRKSVHAKAGPRNEDGRGTPLPCFQCHGDKAHGLLPVDDPRSPVFLENQVQTCGRCHEQYRLSYSATVHGTGLYESGLLVTAVCADCHGAHGIFYAADRRSTLHSQNVAQTCSKCHKYVAERLARSVHGGTRAGPKEAGSGKQAATGQVELFRKTTAGGPNAGREQKNLGKRERFPGCTDCHEGHKLVRPEGEAFRELLPHVCGNCHAGQSATYLQSLHGQLTEIGYVAAANCADCHGSHDILPVSDRRSRLALGQRRVETCRSCHPYANERFTEFDPHADYKNAQKYPWLHSAYVLVLKPFNWFLAFFAVHAFFWFLRSFVAAIQLGRHRTLVAEEFVILRFEPFSRFAYLVTLTSPIGLILTGLPLKFSDQPWARRVAASLGGFASTSVWHRFFAAVLLVTAVSYTVRALIRTWRRKLAGESWANILFGPDSLLFNRRDVKDFLGMVRWFFGFGPKPTFERWAYWEKLDFWAATLTVVIIGTTGLAMWYPQLFCSFTSGRFLNIAKVVHSDASLYVVGLLLFIHLVNTHFRPEKFPVDLSVLTGMVSESHLRRARPDLLERWEREGRLASVRRPAPARSRVRLILLGGLTVAVVSVVVLGAVVVASLGK